MANARVSWVSANENLEAAFAIRNLSDERAGIQGFDLATLCGCNEVSYRAPRHYTLNVRYNF
jgi:iron complex outermembrane receptor protein